MTPDGRRDEHSPAGVRHFDSAQRAALSANALAVKGIPPRGFTLIEVLVVIVIVGITVSLITVNFASDEGASLEDEARRLALLVQFARDDAIVSGQSVALTAEEQGYVFSRREFGRGWVPYTDLPVRSAVAVPFQSRLRVAGVDVPAGEPLVFSASGMALPYELVLAAAEWQVTLAGDSAGKVSVSRAVRRDGSPR